MLEASERQKKAKRYGKVKIRQINLDSLVFGFCFFLAVVLAWRWIDLFHEENMAKLGIEIADKQLEPESPKFDPSASGVLHLPDKAGIFNNLEKVE